MAFCSKCGNQLAENAAFCAACGAAVQSGDAKSKKKMEANLSSGASSDNTGLSSLAEVIFVIAWIVFGLFVAYSVGALLMQAKPGTEEAAGQALFTLLVWFIGAAIYIAFKKRKQNR